MPIQCPERFRERAFRMVGESLPEHETGCATVKRVATKLEISPEAIRRWKHLITTCCGVIFAELHPRKPNATTEMMAPSLRDEAMSLPTSAKGGRGCQPNGKPNAASEVGSEAASKHRSWTVTSFLAHDSGLARVTPVRWLFLRSRVS